MVNDTHHTRKGASLLFLVVSVAILVLALGLSSASATISQQSGTRKKLVVLSTSPAQPISGKSYTMTFALQSAGLNLPMATFDCFAMGNNRLVPIIEKAGNGTVAHCTWAVPAGLTGKTLDGMLAVKAATQVWYYRGFDLPIS
jgi:hypothetical protein